MLSKLINSGIIAILLLLYSCNTYNTFYSETYTTTAIENPEKVLRLNLSATTEFSLKDIKRCTALKMLDLSNHSSQEIAKILHNISNPELLEVLLLNNADLKELPNDITKFINLKQLSLNKNPKLHFEKAFEQLQELPIVFLNLQHNHLESLPESIKMLKSIKDLNLSNNRVRDGRLFDHLSQLPRLYSLWLRYNEMEVLPKEIGALSQLRNLYIGHNRLKQLPQAMTAMKKVWVLQASHNLFTELPIVLIEMPSLFSAHVNNCEINKISEAFALNKYSMKGLLLDNNKLHKEDKERWKKEFNNFFLLSIK